MIVVNPYNIPSIRIHRIHRISSAIAIWCQVIVLLSQRVDGGESADGWVVLAGRKVILVQPMHGVILLIGVLKLLVLLPAVQGRGAAKSIVDVILIYITDAANNHTIAAKMVFDIYFCFHKPYKFCFVSFSIANIHISVCLTFLFFLFLF